MAIDTSLIKIYPCATWSEGLIHGGAIDTASVITDTSANNIYDDVTDAERLAGVTDSSANAYRKVFIRNENADTLNTVKCWISQNTLATNDAIHIKDASGNDTTLEADDYAYVTPTSKVHADVLNLGNLTQNASAGVWVQRLVDASGNGYRNNTFIIAFEDVSGNQKTITGKYDIFTPATANVFDVFDYPFEIIRENIVSGYTDQSGNWVDSTTTETQVYGHISDVSLKELSFIDPAIVSKGMRKFTTKQPYGFKVEDKIKVIELDGTTETEWVIYQKQSASTLMQKYMGINRETYLLRKII